MSRTREGARRSVIRSGVVSLLLLLPHASAGTCDDQLDLRLSAPRVAATANRVGANRVLVVGGLKDSHSLLSALGTADLIDCDAAEGALSTLRLSGKVFAGRAIHAAAPLPDGRLLIAGGSISGGVEVYRPEADGPGSFHFIGTLPGGPRADLTATTLADGRVLIAGGMTAAGESSRRTDLFLPTSNKLVKGPDLAVARHGHTATLLKDGRVLVAGGVGESGTELFDPEKNRFVKGPEMAQARDDHAASLLEDGTVLITGGQLASGRSVNSTERFDPTRGRFVESPPMRFDRADHVQVVLPDGAVLVLGGESDDGAGHDTILDSVERFDPKSGRFEKARPMQQRRDDHAAALLPDGTIVIAGGQGPGDRALDTVEFYRPG